MDTRYEFINGVKEINSPKVMIGDRKMNENKYENDGIEKGDNFVVDLESISSGIENDLTSLSTTNPNSRITLHRSLSRKIPPRGIDKKNNDRDILAASLSPRVLKTPAAQCINMPEKPLSPIKIPMGSLENSIHHQLPQHQITIKTDALSTTPEGRWGRRSSFKRSPSSWFAHPKRVLLIFATLSCMGTMLLIFFTLSMTKRNEKQDVLEWQ